MHKVDQGQKTVWPCFHNRKTTAVVVLAQANEEVRRPNGGTMSRKTVVWKTNSGIDQGQVQSCRMPEQGRHIRGMHPTQSDYLVR